MPLNLPPAQNHNQCRPFTAKQNASFCRQTNASFCRHLAFNLISSVPFRNVLFQYFGNVQTDFLPKKCCPNHHQGKLLHTHYSPPQRPKKSELSGWQLSTRKNFPDEVRKSFLRQKKRVNRFRDKKVCVNSFCDKKSA